MDLEPQLILVDASVLPSVFLKVLEAKKLVSKGIAKSSTEACRMVDISRSASVSYTHLLGICLGMQMLFEESSEFEVCKGLGLIPGKVDMLKAEGLKIPHMGWNELNIHNSSDPLLHGVTEGDCVYFVHSYMAYTMPEYLSCLLYTSRCV